MKLNLGKKEKFVLPKLKHHHLSPENSELNII